MVIGIGCFDWMFSLQVKTDSKLHQVLPQQVAYALMKIFKEELERLQQQDIITPLQIDEMAEWCNSLVLVPKHNGKVRTCLEPARLNQLLIRLVHRGPTLIDIFPNLNNVKYLSFIDVSSGYHNLKLDERSSYLSAFMCQFGRYRYKRSPFGAAPIVAMSQCKIEEILKNVPNVFDIVGYDTEGKIMMKCCDRFYKYGNR